MTVRHRLPHRTGLGLAGLLACLWLADGACSAELPVPASESWRVHQVRVNEWRSDRLLYQVDDPRLVGRVITIRADRIDADLPDATACAAPSQRRSRVRLNTLLDQSMWPAMPGHDAALDFGLPGSGHIEVDVRWMACQSGTWGPAPLNLPVQASASEPQRHNWLAVLPDGLALLRWYGDTLLVLKPASPQDKVQPSFACAKTRRPAERAICGDTRLAAYDLSLAQAWALATRACDREPECLRDLKRSQGQWVSQRNDCQQDLACLRKAMQARLNTLMMPPE